MSKLFHEVCYTFAPSGSPAYWPVTLTDAKEALNFGTIDASDTRKIENLIPVAVEMVETDAQRAIANQTWKLYMDEFPCETIELRRPPIQAVSSITYTDTDGATQTLSASLYDVDITTEPGRVTPAYGQTWPSTRCESNAVTVTFTAGYVSTPVPAIAIKAILLALKALWYDCEPSAAYYGLIDRLRWEGGL